MRCCIRVFITIITLFGSASIAAQPHSSWHRHSPLLHHQNIDRSDLWQVLRENFHLQHTRNHPKVAAEIEHLLLHPEAFKHLSEQARPYLHYIFAQIKERNLPPELALVPMIESAYDPFAYSPAGAAGLWQLMPTTALGLGLKQNWWFDARRDVYQSTQAALRYLEYLHSRFGDWLLALAAYDSGEGTVRAAMNRNRRRGKATDYWSLPLPRETQNYLPRLLALVAVIAEPDHYGIELPKIENKPHFVRLKVKQQVNLAQLAKLTGISEQKIYQLNSGCNRWATDPNGPHHIILPASAAQNFTTAQPDKPNSKVVWQHYTVKEGDNLARLARRFDTSISAIKEANKLLTDILNIDQTLLLPTHAHSHVQPHKKLRHDSIAHKLRNLAPKRYVYHVRRHDTLPALARRYHVTVAAIKMWNNMQKSKLALKQRLIIWSHLNPKQISRARYHKYRAHCSDNLQRIARRFRTTVKRLQQSNPGLRHRALACRQYLAIPL